MMDNGVARSRRTNKRPKAAMDLKLNLFGIGVGTRIIRGLYLAGEGVTLEELRHFKIRYVVNCTRQRLNCFENSGIAYYFVNIGDNPSFSDELFNNFREAGKFIDDALKRGEKVLVQCQKGISRSPSVVAAYLMLHQQMRADEALNFISSKRFVQPNEGFKKALYRLDLELHAGDLITLTVDQDRIQILPSACFSSSEPRSDDSESDESKSEN